MKRVDISKRQILPFNEKPLQEELLENAVQPLKDVISQTCYQSRIGGRLGRYYAI